MNYFFLDMRAGGIPVARDPETGAIFKKEGDITFQLSGPAGQVKISVRGRTVEAQKGRRTLWTEKLPKGRYAVTGEVVTNLSLMT